MAPEILTGQKYNNSIDIWSIGCIIYELCTLNYCFDCPHIFGLCNQIINENPGKIDEKIYKKDLQELIDLLLKKIIKKGHPFK